MSSTVVSLAGAPGKREQNKLANRAQILEAARAVFFELGYETATVRDIIRRTGLSVGAFYNYYRSKEEVYEALADDGARRFRPLLRAVTQEALEFDAYIRAAVRAYFDFLIAEENPGADHSAFPSVRMETPQMRAVFEEVKAAVTKVIERGAAPKVDADYLAGAAIAVAREIGERMLRRKDPDVAAAADFAAALILGGLPALPRLQT
jgi:AcrR family transcriptional regulator